MKHVSYEDFIAKFNKENPKTTDDCYTPKPVMDIIEEYVHKRYAVPFEKMVRPFYPGGDYEHEDYTDCVVVDNPPFSICKKIQKFYVDHGVKFFLFAPGLMFNSIAFEIGVSGIWIKPGLIYNNGANVHTAFVTNMEPTPVLFRDDDLSDAITQIQKKEKKKSPVPINAITAAKIVTYGGRYYLRDFYKPAQDIKKKCFGGCLLPIGEDPRYD